MNISKWILNAGYRACVYYNLFVYLRSLGFRRIGRLVLALCKKSTGVEFSTECQIGKYFNIAHGQNVVIGGTSIIGSNVTVYNGVTIGLSGKLYVEDGKVIQRKGHPRIDDNCIIYTCAKIFGDIKIGKNSISAANSVVIHYIPENSVVVGIPGNVVKQNEFDLSHY